MVEALDPHSPEWWRLEAEKIREQREKERPATEEADRRAIALYENPSPEDIDVIDEIVSEAVGWFDTNRPCAKDPDDFCAEYDHLMLEDAEAAVRTAGYDLDHPDVGEALWESYWHSKNEGSWVGRLRLTATPEQRILHLINIRLSQKATLEELREALVAGVRWMATGEEPTQRRELLYGLFDDLQETARSPEQMANLLHFSYEEGVEASGLQGAMRRLEQTAVAEANARERRTTLLDTFRGQSRRALWRLGHRSMGHARERSGDCATRTRGSKRGGASSRPSGGSDPPGGDDGPGERPRQLLRTKALFVALVACVACWQGATAQAAHRSQAGTMRVNVEEFALMVNDFAVVAGFRLTPADLDEIAYLDTREIDDLYDSIEGNYEIYAEMLGASIKIDASDACLLGEVRMRGATPDLIKRANRLLDDGANRLPCEAQPPRPRCRPAPLPITRRRPDQGRSREARCGAPRAGGSRRVESRSAGGGSSGNDDGSGEPEPPARGRRVSDPEGSVRPGRKRSFYGSAPAVAKRGSCSKGACPGSFCPWVDPGRKVRGRRTPPYATTSLVNHDKGGRHDDDRCWTAT